MALCYFPSFTCTSQKPGTFASPLHTTVYQLFKWVKTPQQRRASTFLAFSSSSKNPSSRKLKVTKPAKSNIDLCEELRNFISIAGFPPTHVPSLKELSQNGRQDLANIVRRRGYKFITELLRDSAKSDTVIVTIPAEEKDSNSNSPGQDKKRSDLVEEVSFLSRENSSVENHRSSANGVFLSNTGNQINRSIDSRVTSPLLEKASKFVQTGELDTDDGSPEDIQIPSGSNLGYGILDPYNDDASNLDAEMEVETIVSNHESSTSQADVCNNTASIMSIDGLISEHDILPFTKHHHPKRKDNSSSEGDIDIGSSDENSAAEDSEKDHQIEIDKLKAMLHQKELELFELKQQIESEKVTLSLLQTKAATEIENVQRIVLEKDAQLLAAEESLNGLKEVRIEYWSDGEVVEVAGSFNGWHHRIKMEQDPLPQVISSNRSREPVMWSALLWLYPGIYEIKFVVDGHWRIDTHRELISKGNIQNNILRVDR